MLPAYVAYVMTRRKRWVWIGVIERAGHIQKMVIVSHKAPALKERDVDYRIVELMRKDSLELTEEDRRLIRATVEGGAERRFVITHGTDTMVDTARALIGMEDKIVVLTGALSPARFLSSDAEFNVGMAVAAVQVSPPGVYIAMSGQVFKAGEVRKNRKENRFEQI